MRNVLLTIALLCLTACAQMTPNFEQPDVEVTSINMLPSQGIEARFLIGLRVSNPNRIALKVVGMSYDVSLEGIEIIKGVTSDVPTIPAYGTEEFKIPASANLVNSLKLLSGFMTNPKDKLKYSFGAKLDVGSSLLPALRISDGGEINLTQLQQRPR
jgi:LEA14-like dessication related protein